MIHANFDGIEANSPAVVEAIGAEAVEVSRYIFERYATVEPARDRVFQFIFRSAYRMDNAGLTLDFKNKFFELFGEAKCRGYVDVADIVQSLQAFPTKKGHASLQFSFATKLANTVDSTMPLYDLWVAKVFGFKRPKTSLASADRLLIYMDFYGVLKELYCQVIERNLLAESRTYFKSLYGAAAMELPEHKILDFIFWSAGKLDLYVHLDNDLERG